MRTIARFAPRLDEFARETLQRVLSGRDAMVHDLERDPQGHLYLMSGAVSSAMPVGFIGRLEDSAADWAHLMALTNLTEL